MDWDFISISRFKPTQSERMVALGHIFACGVLPIQHKVLRCHEDESFLST